MLIYQRHLTDFSFDYRSIDNKNVRECGLTDQERYLYEWGTLESYRRALVKEWKVIPQPGWHYIQMKVKHTPQPNVCDVKANVQIEEVRWERHALVFGYSDIQAMRRKHPVPGHFHDLHKGRIGLEAEREDPLSGLISTSTLDDYGFDKGAPMSLRLRELDGVYVFEGWKLVKND